MVADGDKISENIALKLFDQVKYTSDQNTTALKDLTRVVGDLTKCIEKQPDLNDMARVCISRGHDVNDLKKVTDEINEVVKMVSSKLGVVIKVVIVVFALMATSYLFVRNSVEDIIDRRVTEIHKVFEPKLEGE